MNLKPKAESGKAGKRKHARRETVCFRFFAFRFPLFILL
jgi:hypothetical protein